MTGSAWGFGVRYRVRLEQRFWFPRWFLALVRARLGMTAPAPAPAPLIRSRGLRPAPLLSARRGARWGWRAGGCVRRTPCRERQVGRDAKRTRAGNVNGYLNRDSAQCGDTVTAYLSSPGAGVGGFAVGVPDGVLRRRGWAADLAGHRTSRWSRSPRPRCRLASLLTVAPWRPTLTFQITGRWTPGYYLLVVRAPGQTASSIPLVVRADGDRAPLGFQASVLTYQAYNTFGGHSAYANSPRKAVASTEVSFDRPYEDGGYYSPYQYELPSGAGDREARHRHGLLHGHRHGLRSSSSCGGTRAIVTGGHSEYWTKRMYDGAVAARQAGVNIGLLRSERGLYSRTPRRFAAGTGPASGDPAVADRRRAGRERPLAGDGELGRAAAEPAGGGADRPGYGYLGASGSLRVLHPESWLFAGPGCAPARCCGTRSAGSTTRWT